MHKTLIQKAFKKAKEERKEKGDNKPSKINISKDISYYINGANKYQIIGERSLREYFNDAVDLNTENGDININQLGVVNGLCHYLGFEDYEDFKDSLHRTDFDKKTPVSSFITEGNSINIWAKKSKIIIILSFLVLSFFIVKVSLDKQRWMVWEKDHYVEVKFDLDRYDLNQLKTYKEERILKFKKVKSPDCNTKFFNDKGEPITWYWKKNYEEIELYTDFGLHPTTRKTLKPITKYMIRKYICSD